MKKKLTTIFLGMVFLINIYGQNTKDLGRDVLIYEYGDSLVSCDTNFKNLFKNWTVKNITNASDYKLQNYSFVETISDPIILETYVRLFTSNRMFGASVKEKYHSDIYGTMERKFAIQPNQFNLATLFATINKRVKKLLEDPNFTLEVMRMYSDEYNVNDSVICHYSTAPDTLSDSEYKKLMLESIRKERLMTNRYFKDLIKLGDLVYAILFRYNGKLYTNYVICDPKSKKVICDSFFLGIRIWVEDEKQKK